MSAALFGNDTNANRLSDHCNGSTCTFLSKEKCEAA